MKKNSFYCLLFLFFSHLCFGQSVTLLPGNTSEGTVVSRSTKPIITMYGSGVSETTKMLFSYSTSYTDWGLQYIGAGVNKMNFISAGVSALSVDLNNRRVGVNRANASHTLDVNGTVNATSYLLNGLPTTPLYYFASGWITSPAASVDTTVDGTCLKSRRLPAPELTAAMINGASVNVYFRIASVGPYLLPYISEAGGATNQVNSFLKKAGEIVVFRHTFNSCRFTNAVAASYSGEPVMVGLPQALEYRYVIIKN